MWLGGPHARDFLPLAQASALIVVLLVAASMYRRGAISIGTITAFVLYLIQLFDPIGRFTEWLGDFRQGLAALAKIVGLLEAPNAIVERPAAVELPREGVLVLRDVTFGYDGARPVVRNVSLRLETGEHVAQPSLIYPIRHGARVRLPAADPEQDELFGESDLRDAPADQ